MPSVLCVGVSLFESREFVLRWVAFIWQRACVSILFVPWFVFVSTLRLCVHRCSVLGWIVRVSSQVGSGVFGLADSCSHKAQVVGDWVSAGLYSAFSFSQTLSVHCLYSERNITGKRTESCERGDKGKQRRCSMFGNRGQVISPPPTEQISSGQAARDTVHSAAYAR